MTLRPATRTYGQVKRAVKRTFGDEAGVQLEDADILQWANDAQQAINTKNKILKAKSSTTSEAGKATYDFPYRPEMTYVPGIGQDPIPVPGFSDIQQVESITYDGSPLTPVEMATAQTKIQASDPQQEVRGTPLSWYEWAGQFTLFPVPDEEKQITVYYTRYPVELDGTDDQKLDVPDKYYQAVVDYVLWKCYELDEDWKGAQIKEGHFRGALEEQSEEERESAHLLYPVVQEIW